MIFQGNSAGSCPRPAGSGLPVRAGDPIVSLRIRHQVTHTIALLESFSFHFDFVFRFGFGSGAAARRQGKTTAMSILPELREPPLSLIPIRTPSSKFSIVVPSLDKPPMIPTFQVFLSRDFGQPLAKRVQTGRRGQALRHVQPRSGGQNRGTRAPKQAWRTRFRCAPGLGIVNA